MFIIMLCLKSVEYSQPLLEVCKQLTELKSFHCRCFITVIFFSLITIIIIIIRLLLHTHLAEIERRESHILCSEELVIHFDELAHMHKRPSNNSVQNGIKQKYLWALQKKDYQELNLALDNPIFIYLLIHSIVCVDYVIGDK